MFTGGEIDRLVDLLTARHVSLYHACQLADFHSYLRLGGIPSRSLLERSGLPFTAFDTDLTDRERGVWEKVFVNLTDFGRAFASGGHAVPNAYGPILLQLWPTALRDALDVAICLRSAGAPGYDRERECLPSVEAVDGLYRFPAAEGPPRSATLRYRDELRMEYPEAEQPEISLSTADQLVSLRHTLRVRVDPYEPRGVSLLDRVGELAEASGLRVAIYERDCVPARRTILSELGELLQHDVPFLAELAEGRGPSEALRAWARDIHERRLEWQFDRYARYLRAGTLFWSGAW